MSEDKCAHCGAKIKTDAFIGKNRLFDAGKTAYINRNTQLESDHYCEQCGPSLYSKAASQVRERFEEMNNALNSAIKHVMVVTTHSHADWRYRAINIVTGQSTTGTGVFSEFTSSFTDFFGAQSGSYNKKLAAGEEQCLGQLRAKAIAAGGNAVIATDIDYSEIGGSSGMLMVCAAGTAVRLENTDILGPDTARELTRIGKLIERREQLEEDLR